MDAQEIKQLKELQDAYLSVYEAKKVDQDEDFELWVNDLIGEGYDLSDYTWDEMYESYLDEGLRSAVSSAVKRLLGGGKKETEAPKPESRGAELRRRYNVGPEGSDTSAKRQILNRSRARAERDQERYGDKPFQKQVAQQSKAAHDRYLKAGYSKYGADLPVSGGQGGSGGSGAGRKARKRAEALQREEFEIIVNALVEEGYDLSSYTWNEMYDICLNGIQQLDEISPELRAATDLKRREKLNKAEAEEMRARDAGAPMRELSQLSAKTSDAAAQVSRHRRLSSAHARSRSRINKEEVDIFDAILEHLIAEGYANTNESALVIMANMSEGWRQSIVDSSI